MSEPIQEFQSDVRAPNEHVLALAWNIATQPKIYRELVSNPYSTSSLEYISQRFPNEKMEEVIAAVALSEPEGMYDWNIRQLSDTEQASEVEKQQTLLTQMRDRLLLYVHTYAAEFAHLPKDLVYVSLCVTVFGSADEKIIEQTYAQAVRRDLRLRIIQAIEDIRLSAATKDQSIPDEEMHMARRDIKNPLHRLGMFSGILSILALFVLSPSLKGAYGAVVKQAQSSDTERTGAVLGSKEVRGRGSPVRLKIPKINVDAEIQYVASTSDGTMGVPDNTVDVGWYKLGPRPGEFGSAVIAGHLNDTEGGAGVFVDLHTLVPGDMFSIEDDNGKTTMFTVRESRMYDPGYAEAVFSKSDGKYVNLITCDGSWDEKKNDYSKRLVIFAQALSE